mmetsp:Transcript_86486/g.185328  ORF Transcript_86486/g.185328 Transcript_86486/m.185328 type:complete len:139 (-) Transcript_86486:62-478(-)
MDGGGEKFQKMVEEMQHRVQTQMLSLEKKMTKCALSCYDGKNDYNSVHKCVDSCQGEFQQVGKKVSSEFQSLQGSIQACQQMVAKRLEPRFESARDSKEAQEALKLEFEQGAQRCIAEAQPLLPEMEARIKGILKAAE